MDNIAELYDLHCFKSASDHLDLIDSHRDDNSFLFPDAECVEGGVCGPNPMQGESNASNQYPVPTIHPAEAIPWFIYQNFYPWANNRSMYADGFNNCTIHDKDGHIPLSLIMFTCTTLHHALLEL
jgi:hypothetical protein